MNTKKSVEVLRRLIIINDERIRKYESAMKGTEHATLRELFGRFINTSKRCKLELLHEVDHLGSNAEALAAPVINTEHSDTAYHPKNVLQLIEENEDNMLETYNSVLTHDIDFLTIEQHKMIYKQYVLVKDEHEKARALRSSLLQHQ